MSDIRTGYLLELQDKYGLLESFAPDGNGLERMLQRATSLVLDAGSRGEWQKKRDIMLAEKIDVAQYITGVFEEFLEEGSQ